MKLPTGIRVLCLNPKKKKEITSISTLSLTVHCLAQRKNWENVKRPIVGSLSNIWKHILVADHLYRPQANSRRGFIGFFQSLKMSLKKSALCKFINQVSAVVFVDTIDLSTSPLKVV